MVPTASPARILDTVCGMRRSTGVKPWQVDAAGFFGGPPIVDDGRVVVPCADDRVYVLDAGTGDVVWGYHRAERNPLLTCVPRAVACRQGLLLLTEPGPGGYLQALDEAGQLCWEQPLDDGPGRDVAADDGIVVAATAAALHGFDTATGRPRWHFAHGEAPGTAWVRPLILPDLVVGAAYRLSGQVGTGHTSLVVALARTDGRELWRSRAPEHGARVAGDADLVLVATTEGRLEAHDPRTGTRRWTQRFASGAEVIVPVLAGERVWFGSGDGHVCGLDRATGEQVLGWPMPLPPTALTLAGGVLYIGTHDGGLAAYRTDGHEIWWRHTPMGSVAGLTVAGGTLYASAGRHVATFDPATGDGPREWRRRTTGRGPA
jgi:outer membrane protein assembly factor BamB